MVIGFFERNYTLPVPAFFHICQHVNFPFINLFLKLLKYFIWWCFKFFNSESLSRRPTTFFQTMKSHHFKEGLVNSYNANRKYLIWFGRPFIWMRHLEREDQFSLPPTNVDNSKIGNRKSVLMLGFEPSTESEPAQVETNDKNA